MIVSSERRHRQAMQSDKHAVVGTLENLMVDGRGKMRPFGLTKPSSAPTAEAKDGGGSLRRDIGYSYRYTFFDSYHDTESEPSDATKFVSIGSSDTYQTVSLGEYSETDGSFNASVVCIAGDGLSEEDGHYVGNCIAVNVVNNDRATEWSQWQYRSVKEYEWKGEYGRFVVNRPFVNVDTDPDDQKYEARISDMDMEEGEVGGKSAGKKTLLLDANASTDAASYRMKVIRIVQGVGVGQSRIIVDAQMTPEGKVQIEIDKAWKKKPKYVDETKPAVAKAREKLEDRKNVRDSFFKRWYSSSYVISDPLRYSGLCVDGEITAVDKKRKTVTIGGLASEQSLLSGSVINYSGGGDEASKATMVISLENATASGWDAPTSLEGKRVRITDGPGAGREYVIETVEESGENSLKLILDNPTSNLASGRPNASSSYVIYTVDEKSSSSLQIERLMLVKPSEYLERAYDTFLEGKLAVRWHSQSGKGRKKRYIIAIDNVPKKWWDSQMWLNQKLVLTLDKASGEGWAGEEDEEPKDIIGFQVPETEAETATVTLTIPGVPSKKMMNAAYSTKKWTVGFSEEDRQSTYCIPMVTYGKDKSPDGNITRIFINDIENSGFTVQSVDGTERKEVEEAVNGLYSLSFKCGEFVREKGEESKYRFKCTISRRINRIAKEEMEVYENGQKVKKYVSFIDVIGTLPELYASPSDPTAVILEPMFTGEDGEVRIFGNASREGFYAGWMVMCYPADIVVGKARQKCKKSRCVAFFDATGEIMTDKNLAGIKEGWQVVMFSEYTRCLGSALNPAENAIFYRKGNANAGVYDDYVPLETFAANDDEDTDVTPYEGWTVEVLAKGKTKKNGTTKYTRNPDGKRESSRKTVVKYFPYSRRAYVHYDGLAEGDPYYDVNGEPYKPMLNGNEHIWLYDESSYVGKFFNEDESSEAEGTSGIRMRVTNIHACPYDGVDKIRLYRANELSEGYRLVATLENRNQAFLDNTPEEELSTTLEEGHAAPPPTAFVAEYKTRFVFGGAIDARAKFFVPKNGCVSVSAGDYSFPVIQHYTYTGEGSFIGTVRKTGVAAGICVDSLTRTEFDVVDKAKTETVKISLCIDKPQKSGIIAYCEKVMERGTFQRTKAFATRADKNYAYTHKAYLSKSASSVAENYFNAVLDFDGWYPVWSETAKSYKWIPQKYSVPFYYGNTSEDCRYTDTNKQFQFKNVGVESAAGVRVISDFVYPTPYTIRTALWVVWVDIARDGEGKETSRKYWLRDMENKTTPKEIHPVIPKNGGMPDILYISEQVHQGDSFSEMTYVMGGRAERAVSADVAGYGSVSSTTTRVYSFAVASESNDVIEAFACCDCKTPYYPNEEAYYSKPVLITPECIDGACSAPTYRDGADTEPLRKLLRDDSGNLCRVVILDRIHTGEQSDEPIELYPRENATRVFITSAASGVREMCSMENAWNFIDQFGNAITGIVAMKDFVVVFKRRGIYALDPDTPSIEILSNDIGCMAPDSIALGRQGLYWMAESRRIICSAFTTANSWKSQEIQPWLDGLVDIDGWWVVETAIEDTLATYDVENDEYVMYVPVAKDKGATMEHRVCMAYSAVHDQWFRIEDRESENNVECAFRHTGYGSIAGSKGIRSGFKGYRGDIDPWRYLSTQRDEGNSGYKKLIKRIQIVNMVDREQPADEEATFKFFKDMEEEPDCTLQAEDFHQVRRWFTNVFSQSVHVGLRCLMWQFLMEGNGYTRIHDFSVQFRSKGDSQEQWITTGN